MPILQSPSKLELSFSDITISSFTSLLINTLNNGHRYLVHQVINLAFQLLQHIRWYEEVGFIKVLKNNFNQMWPEVKNNSPEWWILNQEWTSRQDARETVTNQSIDKGIASKGKCTSTCFIAGSHSTKIPFVTFTITAKTSATSIYSFPLSRIGF